MELLPTAFNGAPRAPRYSPTLVSTRPSTTKSITLLLSFLLRCTKTESSTCSLRLASAPLRMFIRASTTSRSQRTSTVPIPVLRHLVWCRLCLMPRPSVQRRVPRRRQDPLTDLHLTQRQDPHRSQPLLSRQGCLRLFRFSLPRLSTASVPSSQPVRPRCLSSQLQLRQRRRYRHLLSRTPVIATTQKEGLSSHRLTTLRSTVHG